MLPAKATSTSSQHYKPVVSFASSPSISTAMQSVKQKQIIVNAASGAGHLPTVVQTMTMKPPLVASANTTTSVLLNPTTVTTVTPQQAAVAAKNIDKKNEIRYLPIATMPTKQNTRNTTFLSINQQNQPNPSLTNYNNNNQIMKNNHGQTQQATLALATTNPSGRLQLLPAKTVNPKALSIPTLTIIAPTNPAASATRMPSLTNAGNILNGAHSINGGGGQANFLRNAATVANSTLISTAGTGVTTAVPALTTTVTSSKVAPALSPSSSSSYKVAANTNSSPSLISLHNKQRQTGLALSVSTTNNTFPQRSASGGITIAKSSTFTSPSATNATLVAFSNGKTLTTTTTPSAGIGGVENPLSATAIALSNGLKQRPRITGNSLLSKDAINQLVKYGQVNAVGAKTFMNVTGNGNVGAPPLAKISKTIITAQNSSQQQETIQKQQHQQQQQRLYQQQQQKQTQKVAKSNQQDQQQKQNQQQSHHHQQQQQQQQQLQLLKQKELLQQNQEQQQKLKQQQQQQKQQQLLEQQKKNQQTQQQQNQQNHQQKSLKQSSQHQQQQQHKANITKATTTTNITVTTSTASKPSKTYLANHNPINKQRTTTAASIQIGSSGGGGGGAGGGQHNITMPVAVLDSQNKIRTINIPTDGNLFLGRKSPLGIITTASSASGTSTIPTGGAAAGCGGAKLLPLSKSILLAAINAPKLQKSSMAVATTEAAVTASSSTQPSKAQSIVIEMPLNEEKQENIKRRYYQQQPQQQQQIVNRKSSKPNRSKSFTGNANDYDNFMERRHSVAIMAKDNITLSKPTTSKASKAKRRSTVFNENETIIETITINDDDDDDDNSNVNHGVNSGNLVNNNHHYYEIDDNFEGSSAANSAAVSCHDIGSDADYEDNIDYLDEVKNIIRARDQQKLQQDGQPPPAKIARNEITEKIIKVTKAKLNNLSRKQKLTPNQEHFKNIINNINTNDAAILQMPFVEMQKSLKLQNSNEEGDNQNATTATTIPSSTHAVITSNESSLLLPTHQRIKLASFAKICGEVTIQNSPSGNSTTNAVATSPTPLPSSNLMLQKTAEAEAGGLDDNAVSNLEHMMMMMSGGASVGGVCGVGSSLNDPRMDYVKETSCSHMLNMLSTFRMLNWHDRVGMLEDSDVRFELNEFNLVQIRERCEKRLGPASYFERPLFERPNRHTDTTVDPLLYLCKRCNYHGPALEFLAPKFCSITCLRRNSIKRKSNTNSSIQDHNDQRKHRRLAQNTDDSLLKKSFRWSNYLEDKSNGYAAPIHLFFNPFPIGPNLFERGMKLEAIDPENCSLFCVCTVADVRGYRLKLSFDGYSSTYDFWINADSMDIFPPGWCEKTKRILQPPKGYYDATVSANAAAATMPFNWSSYLMKSKSRPAPWNLFTHLHSMAMPITNPFKIGMHLEAEDLNDTGKICVATVADILDERIRVHFDGWDDCYDFWVHTSSPYIHHCGWHEGRQQLIVPPDFHQTVFKWSKYISHVGGIEADPEFFAAREPMDFKPDMKLEVVDQRNPCLIRPATVITRKGYRIQLHLDCWPSEYFFWLEDDSPDLHPIGWCEATAHELEAPPGYKARPAQMPCDVNGCRGFGNAKRFHLNVHALRDCCPYAPENWRTKIVKPTRVKPHEIIQPQQHRELPTKETNKDEETQRNTSTPSPVPPVPAAATKNSPKNKKQQRKQSVLEPKPDSIVKMDIEDGDDDDKPEVIKMEANDDCMPCSSSSSSLSSSPKLSVSAPACNTLDVSSHLSVMLSTSSSSLEPPLESKQKIADADADDDNDNDDVKKLSAYSKFMARVVGDYGIRCVRNYKRLLKSSKEYNFGNISSNPTDWTRWDVFEYIERSMHKESVAHIIFEEELDGRGFLQLNQDDLIDYLNIKVGTAAKLFTLIMHLRIAVATKFKTIESGIELDPLPNGDEDSSTSSSSSLRLSRSSRASSKSSNQSQ